MKSIFSSKLVRFAAAALAVVAVAFAGLAFAPSAVHAQGEGPGTPTVNAQGDKKVDPARVMKRLQRETKVQERNLNRAVKAGEKLEKLMDKAKENGKDVSSLQSALTAYNAAVEKAKVLNGEAAKILAAHSGFDANGKVTDPAAALKTVEDAGKALKDARGIVKEAGGALKDAVKAWQAANPRPQPTPKP